MTIRSDIPRLGASLGVLGTILEHRGIEADLRMEGWQLGPRKAPAAATDDVCSCGHSVESHDGICLIVGDERPCWCTGFTAAPKGTQVVDRQTEEKQRARAAEHFQEHRADLAALDALVQRITRRMDIACPPNPEEMKNRRTGEYEPWTPAEVELAGWCSSCWRHEQTFTPIYVDPKGMRRWKGSCSWCGPIRAQHKIDPPLSLLEKHLEGRNISAQEYDEAIEKAKPQPAKSKKKGKKGRKAA